MINTVLKDAFICKGHLQAAGGLSLKQPDPGSADHRQHQLANEMQRGDFTWMACPVDGSDSSSIMYCYTHVYSRAKNSGSNTRDASCL
jgi:hypothetical protein